jgi:hypothetical protein
MAEMKYKEGLWHCPSLSIPPPSIVPRTLTKDVFNAIGGDVMITGDQLQNSHMEGIKDEQD